MSELAGLSVATIAWALVVWFFRRAKAWVPYYVVGAAGAAVLLVVLGRTSLPLELGMRSLTAWGATTLTGVLGISASVAKIDPGTILVTGSRLPEQRTALTVGLESSGLLEAAALVGLVAFLPVDRWPRRARRVALTLAASIAANVLRVSVIVTVLALAGQSWLDFAHLFLARFLFFVATAAIFWYAVTRPTIGAVRNRIAHERS